MTDTSPDSLLWEALPDLTLSIAQTAALCGISVRQLGYWTRQGYVSASGQDARRTYGLEAIRRVLAIRRFMDAGASLRQSLRQISSDLPLEALPGNDVSNDVSAGRFPRFKTSLAPAASDTLAALTSDAAQEAVLKHSLIAFFEKNGYTRDHAGGLAVKLGWSEEDVRVVADGLCLSGILSSTLCQGLTVFRSAAWKEPHA